MKARVFFFIMCFSVLGISAKAQQVSAQFINTNDSLKSAFLNAVEVDSLLYIEDVCPEIDTTGRIPLLLVHGWKFGEVPSSPSGGYWNFFRDYLKDDPELVGKYKPYYVKYWSNYVSVPMIAKEFRRKIEEYGFHERNIVIAAHSMGGLVARSYMEEQVFSTGIYEGQKCGEMVDLLITLSTPHHGSPMANGPARNDHYNLFMKVLLTLFEGAVFNETQYSDVNRSDLRWDNYDDLMDYELFADEKNLWLDSLNKKSEFCPKTTCYFGSVKGDKNASTNTTVGQYKLGAYLIEEGFAFSNDGIVPVVSAKMDEYQVKRLRYFDGYNHADIIRGIDGKREELFDSLKIDLLEVIEENKVEVQIIEPYGGQIDVPLLPCFAVETITGASEYVFQYHPAEGPESWAKGYSSENARVCVPYRLEEELTPGMRYHLSARAMVNGRWTYTDTVLFTAEASQPYDFAITTPQNGDSLETEAITVDWNRSVGADNYRVELVQGVSVFESQLLENTDTTFELDISDLLFYENAGVIVYAINGYGHTTDTSTIIRKFKTGVEAFTESNVTGLKVYPNPVNNQTIIEIEALANMPGVKLVLFDLAGKKVTTMKPELQEGGIYCLAWQHLLKNQTLQAGTYILQVETLKGIKEIKVVVSN
ncbi:MAG: T9SS type A sorting domain-containing protein [Prolixibacteraceae bacterium]|jgi:triacylglycerol esterase/lipase EstA (alpha/beta hydrolase family)|nr:T9SS type A sorting domain-containing protein [Prolixibacteraceae bacterium]